MILGLIIIKNTYLINNGLVQWCYYDLDGSHFTKLYKCTHLVYYEFHQRIESAIEREKQIKKWNRLWKDRMIRRFNPDLRDLSDEIDDMI